MKSNYRKRLVWLLIACFLLVQSISLTAFAETNSRLSGNDRYKTAAAISYKGWPSGANTAILARGDDFADALCAGPLAKVNNAPILLTEPDALNKDTLAELIRLKVSRIFIIGGTGAVSPKVEEALKIAGFTDVERIYGNDRYETSVKVAEKLGNVTKVAIATGTSFADALSVSAAASKLGMPILLTYKDKLPDVVNKYILDKGIKGSYIIGGTGVIDSTVEGSLPAPKRLGGLDRYETNTIVLQEFTADLDFSRIYVAVGDGPNGDEFADALAGTSLAANTSSPIVLAYKNLSSSIGNFLKSKVNIGTRVFALGGEAVVPQGIIDNIVSMVSAIEVKTNYDKAGIYGPSSGITTISGNVVISVPGVTLKNTVVDGDLLLAEGIGNGDVTLDHVTVKGRTFVQGGGPNSVHFYYFNGQFVIVDFGSNDQSSSGPRLDIQYSQVGTIVTYTDSTVEGGGTQTFLIAPGINITLLGNFGTVTTQGSGGNLILGNSSTRIQNLVANGSINITGAGTVQNYTIADGATIMFNGTEIESGGTLPPAGGGIPSTPATAISGMSFIYDTGSKAATGSGSSWTVDMSSLSDYIQIRSLQLNTTVSSGTASITSFVTANDVTISSPSGLANVTYSSSTPIDIETLLGGYLSGNNGVSKLRLKQAFGEHVDINASVIANGCSAKSVTVRLILSNTPSDPAAFDSDYFVIDNSNPSTIIATIKSGKDTQKLSTIGIFSILSTAGQIPYAVRIDGSELQVSTSGSTANENIKKELSDNTWDTITLGALADKIAAHTKTIEIKRTASSSYITLDIRR